MAEVDIVVVTYNSAHVIEGLLDTLPAALDGLGARVVVVDNDSTDGTRDAVRRRRDCFLVEAPNAGYSAGINTGVGRLPGSAPILVLNPDVRLEPGSVRRMSAALDVPGTGISAPRVLEADGRLVLSLRREPTLARALGLTGLSPAFSEYVTELAAYDRPQVADWAVGAALLVSRTCHETIGGWDESFFLYSEETDFCLRARDAGFATRYVPDAVVTHIGGQSGSSNRIHTMQILNRVRLYRRRHGRLRSAAYWFASILSEISWIVRGHRQSVSAVLALVLPRSRPTELGCSDSLIPQ